MKKISIITTTFNSESTIEDTVKSVISQSYPDIEYIIIDGKSIDTTLTIIDKYQDKISKIISEKDKGIYFALNKGIELATGEIIGILHSDDFYAHENVISKVVYEFEDGTTDCVYGDLQYVDKINTDKIIRNWKSGTYQHGMFLKGWMPPHPTFFLKKEHYLKYGCFNTSLKSAADYELMLRLLHKHRLSVKYIPEVLVKMRVGGKSNVSLTNRVNANKEDRLAWKINGLKPGMLTLLLKPLSKLSQFFNSDI